MKFSSTLVAAVAALLSSVEAHVKMIDPAPYGFDQDNSPLAADGSNFPCKMQGGSYGNAASSGEVKTFTPGQMASFQLMGSAVHGGGSCQISITYDNPPTKDSVWKVVQSYEGACPIFTPGNIGDDASKKLDPFGVMLPEGLKAGDAVFAWTWFNKVGNREMYMDCAPIKIGGSGSSMSTYNSLPDMFIANIGNPKSACTTKENVDILFPNPGKNVVKSKDACNFQPACGGQDATPQPPAQPAPAPTEAPSYGQPQPSLGAGQGGAFVGVTSPVYNAPPASKFTPINPQPSTTMAYVPKPTPPTEGNGSSSGGSSGPSYGNGNGSGSSSGSGSGNGSGSGAPSYGPGAGSGSDGGSMTGGAGSYNGGNGSAHGKCDGSWIVKCDAADPGSFTLCYGKGQMTQKFACSSGMTCEQIAKAHPGNYGKFKRTAHEHIKRNVHKHRRH